MTNKIFKAGHSAVVALSPKVLKDLDLKLGDSVRVETDKNQASIIISKGSPKKQLPLDFKVRPKLGQSLK